MEIVLFSKNIHYWINNIQPFSFSLSFCHLKILHGSQSSTDSVTYIKSHRYHIILIGASWRYIKWWIHLFSTSGKNMKKPYACSNSLMFSVFKQSFIYILRSFYTYVDIRKLIIAQKLHWQHTSNLASFLNLAKVAPLISNSLDLTRPCTCTN